MLLNTPSVLRHSTLSYHLWCQYPVWAVVQALAAPFPIQLPAHGPGKAAQLKMALVCGPFLPTWETRLEFQSPSSNLVYAWPLRLFGREKQQAKRSLSFSLGVCELALPVLMRGLWAGSSMKYIHYSTTHLTFPFWPASPPHQCLPATLQPHLSQILQTINRVLRGALCTPAGPSSPSDLPPAQHHIRAHFCNDGLVLYLYCPALSDIKWRPA